MDSLVHRDEEMNGDPAGVESVQEILDTDAGHTAPTILHLHALHRGCHTGNCINVSGSDSSQTLN